MRKRLRKKLHLGEFRELGVEFELTLRPGVDWMVFLDDFIELAIEAHGLQFGGGGSDDRMSGFIELGRHAQAAANLAKVEAWVAADPRVASYEFAEPVDAWYPSG